MRVLRQAAVLACREGSPAQVLLGCLPSQRAHRTGRTMPVPPDMADRWLRWQLFHRGDGTSKRPLRFDGALASSTDPATWTSLPAAERSTAGDGLGFALGGGFACIDLDHCYDSRGHLADWAKMLLAPVAGKTWIEISPSGQDLHIWGRCAQTQGHQSARPDGRGSLLQGPVHDLHRPRLAEQPSQACRPNSPLRSNQAHKRVNKNSTTTKNQMTAEHIPQP